MTKAMTYYHLQSATMSPSTPTAEFYAKARGSWLCPGCARPRPGTGAVDVHLDGEPEDIPLSFVSGVGVGLVRRDLLHVLGEEAVADGLRVGAVFGPDGARREEFATFRGRRMVLIRGDASSTYRGVCGTCGRHLYFPLGKRYLLGPLDPPFDVAESTFHQLVVSGQIRERLGARRWSKLTVQKLPVQSRASDGRDLPSEVEN